jgi:aconitate hydratase
MPKVLVGTCRLAPKYLGQVAVIAQSYARIALKFSQFWIVPLEFINVSDYDKMDQGDFIRFKTFVTMLSIEII